MRRVVFASEKSVVRLAPVAPFLEGVSLFPIGYLEVAITLPIPHVPSVIVVPPGLGPGAIPGIGAMGIAFVPMPTDRTPGIG